MGVDLALEKTGICVLTKWGHVQRVLTLEYPLARRKKSDPPIMESDRIRRLVSVTNDVVGLCQDFQVRWVAIEGYAYSKRYQSHQLGEIAGNVKVQLWLAHGIVAETIPPTSARKSVLGFGNTNKSEVMRVVRDGLGVEVDNDHEADATVIARAYFDQLVVEQKELGFE